MTGDAKRAPLRTRTRVAIALAREYERRRPYRIVEELGRLHGVDLDTLPQAQRNRVDPGGGAPRDHARGAEPRLTGDWISKIRFKSGFSRSSRERLTVRLAHTPRRTRADFARSPSGAKDELRGALSTIREKVLHEGPERPRRP
ncbi:MAG: hypothetical protein ACAI25_02360, partial [Planctomycetota bacterium]